MIITFYFTESFLINNEEVFVDRVVSYNHSYLPMHRDYLVSLVKHYQDYIV